MQDLTPASGAAFCPLGLLLCLAAREREQAEAQARLSRARPRQRTGVVPLSCLVLMLVFAVAMAASVAGGARAAAGAVNVYSCYVNDELNDGYRPGLIVAEGSVDCSGYGQAGSVVFTVRLQQYNPRTKAWRAVLASSRRYATLRIKHVLAVTRRCVSGLFRASYTAVLFTTAGTRVSTNRQALGPLKTFAHCVVTLR